MRRHNWAASCSGDVPYDWSEARLRERNVELRQALANGIAKVRSDPALSGGDGVKAADRPRTRSEQIESALRAYRECPGSIELQALRTAVSGTRLYRKVEELDRWLKRKRPSPGGGSIQYEIAYARRYRAVSDDYAHEPATDFEDR